MAKAAEELAVSRPVISRAIADLERVLGVPLFDRLSSGISPTRYGRELMTRGFAVFDELRQSMQAINRLKDPRFGELRFATGEALAGGVVAAAVERVSKRISVLSSSMEPVTRATLLPYLRERRGELVITRLASDELEPDIAAEPLYKERMLVVAARDSVWSRKRRLSWSELLDAPWILSPIEVAHDSPFIEALRDRGASLPANLILRYIAESARRSAALWPVCNPDALLSPPVWTFAQARLATSFRASGLEIAHSDLHFQAADVVAGGNHVHGGDARPRTPNVAMNAQSGTTRSDVSRDKDRGDTRQRGQVSGDPPSFQ